MKGLLSLLVVLAIVATLPASAMAQNRLMNPGFEDGPIGPGVSQWEAFNNVYTEGNYYPFYPYEGDQLVSMFGNWWGVFNVSGMFQEFPTSPGAEWNMSCYSRHNTADPITGQAGVENSNWVVQKIVFKDGGGNEIGAQESIILDGTFALDTWHFNGPISAIAPPGTATASAFVLYLQPLYDTGAAHIDNVSFWQTAESVDVDIHPGSCPNPINLGGKGVVPVAILGSETFDVNDIDLSTVALEGVPAKKARIYDVASPLEYGNGCDCTTDGPDGFDDLSLKFLNEDVVQAIVPASFKEERTLTLTGYLLDGTPIEGQDCVVILGAPKDMIAGTPGFENDPNPEGPIGPLSLNVRDDGRGHRIEYVLPEPVEVTLSVYDVSGRLVDRLVQSYESAGSHTLAWNAASRPSGIYFYKLTAGGETMTRKVVLVQR